MGNLLRDCSTVPVRLTTYFYQPLDAPVKACLAYILVALVLPQALA
jgi:hypothetical protein